MARNAEYKRFRPGPKTIEECEELDRMGRDLARIQNIEVSDPLLMYDSASGVKITADLSRLLALMRSGAWKQPVRAATTTNITLSGEQTIDGVSLDSGDDVLVKDQTDDEDNGIYVVSPGPWQRRPDSNTSAKMKAGHMVAVTEGTLNKCLMYKLTTADPITLGATSLTYITPGVGSLTQVPQAYSLTANTDNIPAPPSGILYVTPDANNRGFLGMSGGWAGRQITIVNVGTYWFRIPYEGSGTANNGFRFFNNYPYDIASFRFYPGQSWAFMWDTTAAAWLLKSPYTMPPNCTLCTGDASQQVGNCVYINARSATYNIPNVGTASSVLASSADAIGILISGSGSRQDAGGSGALCIVKTSGELWDGGTVGGSSARYPANSAVPAIGDDLYVGSGVTEDGAAVDGLMNGGCVTVGPPKPLVNDGSSVVPSYAKFMGKATTAGSSGRVGINIAPGPVKDNRASKVHNYVGLLEARNYAHPAQDF